MSSSTTVTVQLFHSDELFRVPTRTIAIGSPSSTMSDNLKELRKLWTAIESDLSKRGLI